jgi:predicted permease
MRARLTRFRLRLRATLSRGHDRELREELEQHLRLLEDDYITQGMAPADARRRAHREFGNPTRFQEASHELFSFRLLEEVAGDVRYAAREMRRSAGFTCIAIASLGLGIGATTAAFAVIDAFMLRGLPVRDPQRLVAISTAASQSWTTWSHAAFERWQTSPDRRLEAAAAADARVYEVPIRGSDQPARVRVSLVSANYLDVMGVDIAAGRSFVKDDATTGTRPVAVISHAFWERWFGAEQAAIGGTLLLQGVSFEIVGVARRGFSGHVVGHPSDVWVQLGTQPLLMPGAPRLLEDRWGTDGRWLRVVARLREKSNLEEATASARVIYQRFVADKADVLGADATTVVRDRQQVVTLLQAARGYAPERARYGRPAVILFSITALVLLVACANFTNLMLARSQSRRVEFGIRLALGGGHGRLVRQAATECIALALTAGLLGLVLAKWTAALALKQFAVMVRPVDFALALDARVLGFAATCVAIVVCFGLWPATRVVRSTVAASIHQLGIDRWQRPRGIGGRVVLIGQLTLCTVLLIAAGLLLRTVSNLRTQELGFDRNVLLVAIAPGQSASSPDAAALLVERVRERLTAIKGIVAAGVSDASLLDSSNYWIDGTETLTNDRGEALPAARYTFTSVGPGFFETVGMSLVHGRTFADHDDEVEAVVINQSLARIVFGARDPIGRHFRLDPRAPMQTVIGVVQDAKQTSPRDRNLGVIYRPLRDFQKLTLAVRTAGSPEDAVPVVLHQLGAIAPGLAIGNIRTIGEILDEGIALERLMSGISLVLAIVVVGIGCVGLYALLSYNVATRTREIGIRLALGATGRQVLGLVLRDGAMLVVPALAVGLPLGSAVSQPLSAQLYAIEPNDPSTLAIVALTLIVVAAAAALRPARTASRVDPVALLRAE